MGFFGFIGGRKSLISSKVLEGAVDRHSHILYGVDDGVKTPGEALAIIDYQEKAGVREIWCTPHVMEDVPNGSEALQERFAELKNMYNGSVKLHLAAEYMLDNLFEERLERRDLLTMENDVLLVETSTMAPPYDLSGTLSRVMSAGYRPLFAHPERCRFLTDREYAQMHEAGVLFQLNLASLTGYYGSSVKKNAEFLLAKGWYSAFGSDCHRLRTIKEQYEIKAIASKVAVSLKKAGYLELQ